MSSQPVGISDRFVKKEIGKLLKGSGKVSHDQAMKKAKEEYRKYQKVTISPIEQAYMDTIMNADKKAQKGTGKK